MLRRGLDSTYAAEVRQRITVLTAARTAANACFRFAPPFLATIASGLDVSLGTIGVAVAVSEMSGLLSPVTGSVAERFHRRAAMAVGLVGVAGAALLAAASTDIVVFAGALVVLAQSKVLFDLGLAAWVSERVPYERRGRVIGLTETSWAGGLLLGVSTMGIVTALTSWRVGYALGAVAVLILGAVIAVQVEDDPHEHRQRHRVARAATPRIIWVMAAGVFCLMGASQVLFVTFGSWLRDEFGVSEAGVALVVFGMGFAELAASLTSARVSDRWGKERAGAVGAAVMVPTALLLTATNHQLAVGLPLLVLAIAAFEFAVVSIIPLGTMVVPGAPAFGMSVMLAAGTLGRAAASIPATRSYVAGGLAVPAAMCALLASGTIVSMWRVHRWRGRIAHAVAA